MAKVGVKIEGSETLSPASASAAKSLRKLREETEALKKGVQGIAQPLINIRSTLMGLGMASGAIQLFRGIAREAGQMLDAFAETDASFKATMDNMDGAVKSFRAGLGSVIADIAGPVMKAMTTAFQSMAARLTEAHHLREAIRDVQSGAMSTERAEIAEELTAVRNQLTALEEAKRGFVGIWAQTNEVIFKFFAGAFGWDQLVPSMRNYYDTQLGKLTEVKEALIEQQGKLEEQEKILQRIKGTKSDLLGIYEKMGAEVAELTTLQGVIAQETSLGRIVDLEDKLAILKEADFELEGRWQEARLEAIRVISAELKQLTGGGSSGKPKIHPPKFESTYEAASVGGPIAPPVITATAPSGTWTGTQYSNFGEPTSLTDLHHGGDGGLQQAGQINAFNDALRGAISGIGGFVGGLMQSVATMGPLGLLWEALKPVISGILEVLQPALNDVLAPLMGSLVLIGKALGGALTPILEALVPVFDVLGMVVAMLVPVIDALARPVEFVADMLKWLAQWIRYGIDQLKVFFWNISHSPLEWITGTVSKPEGFSSDAFTRPIKTVDWEDLTNAGDDYLGTGGGDGSGGNGASSTTTVQQVPDIFVYIQPQGNIIGAGGMREVGEYVVDAIGEYLGTGAHVTWLEA